MSQESSESSESNESNDQGGLNGSNGLDNKVLCKVYRSERQQGAYLYTTLDQGLEPVPGLLLSKLGDLTEAMSLLLESSRKLANADIDTVMAALRDDGFYLQMPPGHAASFEASLAALVANPSAKQKLS